MKGAEIEPTLPTTDAAPIPECLKIVGNSSGPRIDITFQELLTENFPRRAKVTLAQELVDGITAKHEAAVIAVKMAYSLGRPMYRSNRADISCDGSSTRP